MIIRNTANYSQNLPICVCSSRKLEKNGKICKNHEEKHKIDVKENEKSGEMRGFATPKTGDAGPKTGDLGTPKRARSPYKQHAQKVKKPTAARPERAEALSPGQRPGYNGNQQCAL